MSVKKSIYANFNYGFSSISFEFGKFKMYTCKLLVGIREDSIPKFDSYYIRLETVFIKYKKSGIVKKMHLITYATTNFNDHIKMSREIGLFLYNRQRKMLDEKFHYVLPNTVDENYGDMELTIPSNTLDWDDIHISTLPTLP